MDNSRPFSTVVLDALPLNPGDLSWQPLQDLVPLQVYERTRPEQILPRCQQARAILTNKVILNKEVLRQLPELKYIGILSTGVNVVDLAAAQELGITVTNIPAYSTCSVTQMVWGLILEMTQQPGHHAQRVYQGAWSACPDFAFWDKPLVELAGDWLGLVGFGAIGQQVAAVGRALGMQVAAYVPDPQKYRQAGQQLGITWLDWHHLLQHCRIISLHCPLTASNRHMVDAQALARMRPEAYLINTARGGLVDSEALAQALEQGRLAGAALDVLDQEPPPADHPLLSAPNCYITPHIGWATHSARVRLLEIATANMKAFLAGRPQNQVP